MKVKVTYQKESDGRILTSLRVVEGEDFPVTYIFDGVEDYPSKDGFILKNKLISVIEGRFDSPDEAVEWAEKQVSALKDHLQKWRAIQVPEETVYII